MPFVEPAGLVSNVEWQNKSFHIQTEFALRPRPRITTSVIKDGETIYKAERPWDGGLFSEMDTMVVEKSLKIQHKKVLDLVKEKGSQIALEKGTTKVVLQDKLTEIDWKLRLENIPGVKEVIFLEREKLERGETQLSDMTQQGKMVSALTSLNLAIPTGSKMGQFKEGILDQTQLRYLLVPKKEKLVIFVIDKSVDVKTVENRIKIELESIK